MPCGCISESQRKLGACALKLKDVFPYNPCELFGQKEYEFGAPLTDIHTEGEAFLPQHRTTAHSFGIPCAP